MFGTSDRDIRPPSNVQFSFAKRSWRPSRPELVSAELVRHTIGRLQGRIASQSRDTAVRNLAPSEMCLSIRESDTSPRGDSRQSVLVLCTDKHACNGNTDSHHSEWPEPGGLTGVGLGNERNCGCGEWSAWCVLAIAWPSYGSLWSCRTLIVSLVSLVFLLSRLILEPKYQSVFCDAFCDASPSFRFWNGNEHRPFGGHFRENAFLIGTGDFDFGSRGFTCRQRHAKPLFSESDLRIMADFCSRPLLSLLTVCLFVNLKDFS